jgi:Sec-independent protein translocase protein TatA
VSGGEVLLLMVIALLTLGAHRLPEAGGMMGKALRSFYRALNEARGAIAEEPPPPRRPTRLID